MTSKDPVGDLRRYLRSVTDTLSTGLATEHSYRPALKELVEKFGRKGTQAINEPTHVECGAPDFIVEHRGVPVGHIECKDVGADLDRAENREQLKRYRDALPNLILTDYIEFRWYYSGSDAPRIAKLVPSQLNYEKDIVGAVCHEHPGWKSASRWRHEPYCVPLRAHGHVASGQSHPGHAVADNYG